MEPGKETNFEVLRLERDLYRRLLELGTRDDPQPFLQEALSLIVEGTRARRGYLALFGEQDPQKPRWWIAEGFSEDEVAEIRQRISSGIIAESLVSGQVIQTDSALLDPRFGGYHSVQKNNISAVLCAPIGDELGVLYLQDRILPGPFTREDKERAEFFARHIAPYMDRLRLREKETADPTLPFRQRLKLESFIGQSRALTEIFLQLESAARFSVPVLLTGPSGTGKTAFARAIHDNSPRAQKPFLELNCAAIPEGLFESELFGALPGAHSTATKKILGKIEAATGGTLFLDEIGELPLSVQGKLLQFLQSKEYFPLGSAQPKKADVRIIVATNVDLSAAVEKKTFREDLFYRLNVLSIRLPALSERRQDIALLAQHFCDNACKSYDLPRLSLTPSALLALEGAEWPGNVRQLAHVIEAALIRAATEGASAVEARHLFPEVAASETSSASSSEPTTFQEATRRFQKKLLLETLEAARWNISETARRLDLTRTHIRHLIQAFGLAQADPRKTR